MNDIVEEFLESDDSQTQEDANTPIDDLDISFLIQILKFVRSQCHDCALFVEDHAISICEQFKTLSAQTSAQGDSLEEVVALARVIDMDGKQVPYEESIKILYEPLGEAINNILQVSKLAMSMVMAISDAADNISLVQSCVDKVQSLTRQTNMLAMNTQIEAARAGEAGRSFRIIAQEVKGLSESIKTVSQQIHDEVNHVSESVLTSSKLVESLANYDMTENLHLKNRVDSLIDSVMDQNRRFTKLLEDSAVAARSTANSINMLVVGIQFQDRNTQINGDLCTLLDYVIDALTSIRDKQDSAVQAPEEQSIENMIKDIKLSEVRNNALVWMNESGNLDSESELYKQHIKPKSSDDSDPNSIDALFGDEEEDDDIELF